VNDELGRELCLAEEREFGSLFKDCEIGAVPALGEAYGLQVIWDDDLQYTADVYIEAGDHEHLIWLDRKDFMQLMSSLPHNIISKDAEVGCWKY
jgi:Ala-tRNA(Pro) deacylase